MSRPWTRRLKLTVIAVSMFAVMVVGGLVAEVAYVASTNRQAIEREQTESCIKDHRIAELLRGLITLSAARDPDHPKSKQFVEEGFRDLRAFETEFCESEDGPPGTTTTATTIGG